MEPTFAYAEPQFIPKNDGDQWNQKIASALLETANGQESLRNQTEKPGKQL
jgi:hypothetical protein